mgnify:CR=1 FL=1
MMFLLMMPVLMAETATTPTVGVPFASEEHLESQFEQAGTFVSRNRRTRGSRRRGTPRR